MELRHLRYFVAVAETESLTLAAKSKLHTSQPSLSRQIRDLEQEIGAQLITRRARGVELTPAGRAFLDHARGVLLQVDAAAEAARRAVRPAKPCFSMGFLTGHELIWMPEALRILRDELPNIDVMISSQYSPLLAEGLSKGTIDAAFLRKERDCVPYGSRTACGHRQLPEAIGNQYHASSPGGPRHHGNFPDNVDARIRTVTCLRAELSPCLCDESPPEGRCANRRSGPWLQKVQPVANPQAFAFEVGRVGCSGVEEDRIRLVPHIVDMAVRRLALRSEDSAIFSVANKSFRIPIAHPTLSLRSFSRISRGWLDRGG
jgi:hypothetical protein